ncbi:MAG: YhbY family RNA-binding protein [Candidatus Bathyarchaeota archaeon]|nr:MAG: YhbY family RNA-binding protein [Candidatus Bathyarchaeota archaeon]
MKRKLSDERPQVLIGKNGVSTEIIVEIDGQLERKEMLKVKILKTALRETTAKVIAHQIAERTNSSLVEVRGHTFMLYRKKKPKK